MPVCLPPLNARRFSRRDFVKWIAAAGAGLAIGPDLSAAPRIDEHSWALLADTHIAGGSDVVRRNVNMSRHLKTVVSDLCSLPSAPAGVFIAGDCSLDSGKAEDYVTLTKLLEPVRQASMPVHLLLGNHDHRENFWNVLPSEKVSGRPVPDKHVALVRSARANWFVLDSLEKTLSTPGLLGIEQLEWLAQALDANADRPALILVHHNPGRLVNVDGLKDTDALFEIVKPRRHVKACFFGHTHNWSVARDESGIHLINLPPVAYVFREGNPSGWVHAVLKPGGAVLEVRCVDPAHREHGRRVELQWRA